MAKNPTTLEYTTVDFDPFAGPEIIGLAPATEQQKEIWTSCKLGGDHANMAYNESFSLRFKGRLQKEAMQRAFDVLTERHEALRSAFSADGQQLCVFNHNGAGLVFEDLSAHSEPEREKLVQQQAATEANTVFDLLNGPLFRATLLTLNDYEHHLTITGHHIVCDGWSINIILQELGKLYSAFVKHEPDSLPMPVLFSDYARQQSTFLQSEDYRRMQQFWVNQYKDDVPVLDLATDYPHPALRTYKSNRLDFKVAGNLPEALRALAKRSGTSFVTTLIAAFEVYLHRLTGQDSVVIGVPAAEQAATGQLDLVGHCVNLLPIRSAIDQKVSFAAYLKERKSAILDCYDNQQLTFGSLLKKLNVARDASRVALVPVVFNVDMGMNDGVEFEGLQHELISNPRAFETFELFLNISTCRHELTFEWSYNTQLFKAETIARMMEGYEHVLRSVVEDASLRIEKLKLFNEQKLSEKLLIWNATEAAYEKNKTVTSLITAAAGQHSNNTAVVFKGKTLSYQHLEETSNQLARLLMQEGIMPGDVVSVALDRSAEMLIALLAVMKSGAAYVPIDPEYPKERIRYMLTDSKAKLVITSKTYKGQFSAETRELLIEKAVATLGKLSKKPPIVPIKGSDLAYILYTSGSTGKPKGVLIRHQSLTNMLLSLLKMPGMTQADVLLAVTTISFDIAAVEMYLPLLVGATIVIADSAAARDGREVLRLLKEQKVSVMQATPATYKMMLAAGWQHPLPLKVLCCGEPLTRDLSRKLLARCASLYNMYGPTETTVYSTGKRITLQDDVITIGKPIDNTQVYIFDKGMNPLPEGMTGEIYIAGDGVAKGYHQLHGLTTEKFVGNPYSNDPDALMYRTGDLGKFLPNGEILCLGRMDQQIKIRGYRIEPGEIEWAIMQVGNVKEALVIARNDGASYTKLVAYVVCPQSVGDVQFSNYVTGTKSALRETLPLYMVPDHFVDLEKIPVLPNGKVDYKLLPQPKTNMETTATKSDTRLTETEQLVRSVWEEFLELQNIGVNDDFFELGGHSLIAVEVMVRIEKETGIKLPLATLFTYPTIKKLATLLDSDKKEISWKSLVPIKPTGTKMPVYIIHGSGLNILNFSSFALHVDKDQPVFGLQAKGLDGSDEPLNDMEEIAAYYIAQVIEHNPDGPYAIAGYSFGGYVANEMARQLRAMGKEVKMLAMFDTNAKEQPDKNSLFGKVTTKTLRQFKKLGWIASSFAKSPRDTVDYQVKFAVNKVKSIGVRLGFSKEEEPEGYMLELKRIGEQHDIAYHNYQMLPFDGTIDLFKAKKRVYFVDDFKYLGWKKYAMKGVRVHEVPGDHKTMLLAPNDRAFAHALQQALDQCSGN